MARRRYQRGSVFLRGKRESVWVGRWREDVIDPDNRIRRVRRTEVLGSKKEFPTKKLALRELGIRLSPVNSTSYRAMRTATFAQFSAKWASELLPMHKPSTQQAIRSGLKNWLVPYFGDIAMKDINGLTVQSFINSCHGAPKSVLNYYLILRMMWKVAKPWGFAMHDPFEGVVLPERPRAQRFFFTEEETKTIITRSAEPYRTLYWIAAETGLRAGELAGLRVDDINLNTRTVSVRQSVWERKIQTPKTQNAYRHFAISPQLVAHLKVYVANWRPNQYRLIFATATGRPVTPSEIMRASLHPLLDSMGIKRCGLHAFRHTNGSMMDRLNAPMKVRQERLGHQTGSDITMDLYTHSVSEDDRKIAAELGAILDPLGPKSAPMASAGNA